MNKIIICLNCNNKFEIPSYKKRIFCSKSCSQKYTKSKNKEWLVKRNETNLKKYGVKTPLENKEIKEKWKNNFLEKHGVTNSFESKEIKEKINETNLKKYGVKIPSKNKEIKEKISNTLKEKIPNTKTKINIRWEKIINYCSLENLIPLFTKEKIEEKYIKDLDRLQFKCTKCNTISEVFINNGYLPTCNKCSNYKGYSLIEEQITNFIQKNYDGDIILKNKSLLKGREIDIYLPNINLAIEVNGLYWHSEIWGKYKNYHLNKTNELLENNIELLHIYDYEWIYKQDIIKSMILNKIKKTPNKIYARKCVVKQIDNNDKNNFLEKNHIQGQCISKINLGLYYNNELVSVMTFGKNRFKKNDNSTELIRFCNKINTNVIGGASKLLKYYINNYKPQKIITFADRRYSQGNLYKLLGFNFLNFTNPSYFYWKNMKIYNRMNYQKHLLKNKLEIFNNELSEYDNMLLNGYNRIWDCGNYKFEMIIDNK